METIPKCNVCGQIFFSEETLLGHSNKTGHLDIIQVPLAEIEGKKEKE
jgi:hypothetical protein